MPAGGLEGHASPMLAASMVSVEMDVQSLPRPRTVSFEEIPRVGVTPRNGPNGPSGSLLEAADLPPGGGPFSLAAAEERGAPRLLDRQGAFQQSKGRMNIHRIYGRSSALLRVLRRADSFHSLVDMSTPKLLCVAAAVKVASWLIFALLFRAVSRQCHLGAGSLLRSLYLSIETVETIGYGVKDAYFHGCYSGILVLAAAGLWESLMNALVISIVYTRISRASNRASSVCFSEKAVLTLLGDSWYLLFQVCDFRKHQLIEAHARLYSVQHAPAPGGVVFQTRAMRLQHPDDELGAMLLLSLPQLVVHRVDPWSPLWPAGQAAGAGHCRSPASSFRFPEIPQRAADGENGNRDPGAAAARQETPSLCDVAAHIQACKFEILCLIEGIEQTSSNTLQARHSYSYDDIVFNACFKQCVSRGASGECEVNFDDFHELVHMESDDGFIVQSMP